MEHSYEHTYIQRIIHTVQQQKLACVNAIDLNTKFKCYHKPGATQHGASANTNIYTYANGLHTHTHLL